MEMRPLIERTIERLITILDLLDGDPDSEPMLGATEYQSGSWFGISWAGDDMEQECEDEGAQCDDEGGGNWTDNPNLGGFALPQ